jgi:shikimate dehydrogenase
MTLRPAPSASTTVVGVIGDPVHHSLSPVLHNAGFGELGLDWVYVAFPVVAGDGHRAVGAARVLGVAGLSVTMPHKAAVLDGLDELGPAAARLGAVNTVICRGGRMVGDSTDGPGLVDALRADHHWDPTDRRVAVLGTGGAARAAILALAEAGAASVAVTGRRADAAAGAAALAGPAGAVAPVEAVGDAELVVDATPVGMTGGPGGAGAVLPLGLDPGRLGPGQLVVDLVYDPPDTPLLIAARAAGAATANGFGMLVHQAGRQLALWTGRPAPLAAMAAAGQAELARRAAMSASSRPGS